MISLSNIKARSNSLTRARSFAKTFFGFPVTIISFAIIFKFIFDSRHSVTQAFSEVHMEGILLGIVFLLGFFLMRSIIWNRLLRQLGYRIEPLESYTNLSLSELRRYIPGTIIAFISRVHYFKKFDVPSKTIIQALFLESILFVAASIPFSVLALVFLRDILSTSLERYIYIALGIILLGTVGGGFYLVRKKSFSLINISRFIPILFFGMLGWLLFGVGNFIIAASITYINPGNLLQISSLFILTWLVGYLSIVTPMGLGVREGLTTLVLSPFVPVSIGAGISIAIRVLLVLSEVLYLGFVIGIKKLALQKYWDKPWQETLIIFSSLLYGIYFAYYTFEKYLNFFNGKYDLGNMSHVLWHTSQGRIFQYTDPAGTELGSRLGGHADFILILLSPLYYIWADARVLLLVQSITLAAGGYILYKLSEVILNNRTLALAFGISFLLNFWIQKQNLFDFHSVALATTFILTAFYFLVKKKMIWFYIFLTLTVLTKENLYLVSFLFGLYLLVKRMWIQGSILSIVSIVIFYLLMTTFIPEARGAGHFALDFYSDFGSSSTEIMKNMLLRPHDVLAVILSPDRLVYFYQMFLPTGFLSLLSPLYLIFTGPDFMINLLSNNNNLRSIHYHYGAVIVPFVYIASLFSIRFLNRWKPRIFTYPFFTGYIMFFALFSTWMYGALPGSRMPAVENYTRRLENREKINTFLEQIPQEYSVAATNNLGPHLTNRRDVFVIPVGTYEADIVLFLLNDTNARPSLDEQRHTAEYLKIDPSYITLVDFGNFLAFRKIQTD